MSLKEGRGGVFEIRLGSETITSKAKLGRFPTFVDVVSTLEELQAKATPPNIRLHKSEQSGPQCC